jgi:hypothetical protein
LGRLLVGAHFDGVSDDQRVTFSFEGSDEMNSVSGTGTITLQGDRMVFTLMVHYGDIYTFECERHASNE